MISIIKKPTVVNWLTWICRLLTGTVFLFSGFIKAIDPWGTIYKFHDYLNVFGLNFSNDLILSGVILLCGYEFMTGAFLVTGSFRKAAPVMATLLMLFMTPLTLWIALMNPVPDCGCFGEALIISNWETFWKNIILCITTVWLLVYNQKVHWLITPSLQWLGFIANVTFICIIAGIGYFIQPLLDFRPYKVGENFIDFVDKPSETQFSFVYEKNGEKKTFTIEDELPSEDDGWIFVERKELPSRMPSNSKQGEKDLTLFDETGTEVTSEVIKESGAQFILLMPEISTVSPASTYQINSLQGYSTDKNIDFIAIAGGNKEDFEEWKDISLAHYPIFSAEETSIKEIARGNPALVYLEDGKIVWKSTLRALPYDDFLSADVVNDPGKYGIDSTAILRNLTITYISITAFLILLSFSPTLLNMFTLRSLGAKNGANHKSSKS